MSRTEGRLAGLRVDRRSFVGLGLKTAAALAALPAASSLLAGCGSGEQVSPPPAPKPNVAPPKPAEPAPPKARTPAPRPPEPADAAGGSGERPLVTEVAAMSATVQALQYVNVSAKADQHCSNCLFFTAQAGGVGKCQLFAQGYVKEGGWCASWAPKPPAGAAS